MKHPPPKLGAKVHSMLCCSAVVLFIFLNLRLLELVEMPHSLPKFLRENETDMKGKGQ